MNASAANGNPGEAELVKLYTQLTGLPETTARGVFMYVCPPEGEESVDHNAAAQPPAGRSVPRNGFGAALVMLGAACLWLGAGRAAAGESTAPHADPSPVPRLDATPGLFTQPLSLAEAVNLALRHNPNILRAQKDIEAAQGIIIETRAIALPNVGITGSYSDVEKTDIDTIQTPAIPGVSPGFVFGTTENWSTQLKLVQSLYQGGRMLSAFRAARLTKQESLLNYQTSLANTVLAVQLAYYDILLATEQISVQEASVDLLSSELADTTRRYDAGTVPRFNVLRAEVELANARPRLIRARNDLRIAKNNLVNLLGFNLPQTAVQEIPLTLSDKLEAEPYNIDLGHALSLALEQRTELAALEKTQALRKEDLVNARSGYKPVLQGYVGYDAHNSVLSQDLSDERYGWIVGAQLTWNVFDGFRTQGRVLQATANYERAGVDVEDTARRIELEVRTDYSNFIEAREVLDSQKKAVATAEEALRLARARYEAGTGTQLDVLSAQTALTESRSTEAQALHDYATARARLERAVGNNVPSASK